MYKVGDRMETPCGHRGVIVWVSKDGKTYAVQCLEEKKHVRTRSDWRGKIKTCLKPVYLLEVEK